MPSFFFEDCSSCFLCFFLHHLICSAVLFLSVPEVWPTYFLGHSAHGILCTAFFLYYVLTCLPFLSMISPSVWVLLYIVAIPKFSFRIWMSLLALEWYGMQNDLSRLMSSLSLSLVWFSWYRIRQTVFSGSNFLKKNPIKF